MLRNPGDAVPAEWNPRKAVGDILHAVSGQSPDGVAVKAVARFGVEWTEQILNDLDTRPETLTTEVQAIRVGDVFLVADPAELFTTLALDLRR